MALPSFFRSDGWVKSVQGFAVPGAQVYVCTQPANQIIPPTPLQPIFSDPNGIVPIVQPIITDGFGHYDFYVTPGTYTVIVALGGQIQQVYTDQTIGLASGSGGVSVQVNTVPFSSATLLNFTNTASVTWTDNGSGSISAAVSGGVTALSQLTDVSLGELADRQSLVWVAADSKWENVVPTSFEVNGVNFSTGSAVTNALNFVDTSTISWVDGGSGQAEASVKNLFANSGSGIFRALEGVPLATSVTSQAFAPTNNTVICYQIKLTSTYTFRKVAAGPNQVPGAGNALMAIYDVTGTTKLLDCGTNAFPCNNGGAPVVVTLASPVTLNPGTYWLAHTATSTTVSSSIALTFGAGAAGMQAFLVADGTLRKGTATNVASGGNMPSSLGTINSNAILNYADFIFYC